MHVPLNELSGFHAPFSFSLRPRGNEYRRDQHLDNRKTRLPQAANGIYPPAQVKSPIWLVRMFAF
jgi:hypothetical protein